MNIQVIETPGKYIACRSAEVPLGKEQDAADLIGACYGYDVWLLMLHAEALSDDFFQLRTGLAGAVLQKLMNYRIRTALVIPDELAGQGRFKEWVAETNQGSQLRVFPNADDAETWLLQSG